MNDASEAFIRAVGEQISNNEPRYMRPTLNRLRAMGYSDEDARTMMAACLATEMYEMMNEDRPFDTAKYQEMLDRLPQMPYGEEEEEE